MAEIKEKMTYGEKQQIIDKAYILNPFGSFSEESKTENKVYEEALGIHINSYELERILSDEDKKKITDLSPETISQFSEIFNLIYKVIKTEEETQNKYNADIHIVRIVSFLINLYLQAFAKMCSKQ